MTTRAASLVEQLARPVALGWLTRAQAEAALLNRIIAEERNGTAQGSGTLDEKMHIDRHLLNLFIEQQANKCLGVVSDITSAVWPMVSRHLPLPAIRAMAHEVNADHQQLLPEPHVEAAVADVLYRERAKVEARRGPPPRRKRRRYYAG